MTLDKAFNLTLEELLTPLIYSYMGNVTKLRTSDYFLR